MLSGSAENLVLGARSSIYRLLANLFARELTADGIFDLQYGPTREVLDRLGQADGCPRVVVRLAAYFTGQLDQHQTVLGLAEAYAWLFHGVAGPHGAPPYASVYLSPRGQTHQQPEAEINALLRAHGLSFGNYAHEPCDHLAVILEFIAWLSEQDDGGEDAGALIQKQREVLEHYLLSWLPDFVDRCKQGDRQGFYAALAQDCLDFVRADHQQLRAL